jgi:hypothetical protein
MLTIVYASYGTAMGHPQEALEQATRATAMPHRRPSLTTKARRATGAALELVGRRLGGGGARKVAGTAPAAAAR